MNNDSNSNRRNIKRNTIEINAYAKINLSLDVTGLLENGYHEVDMILQMVGLHDVVKVEWIPSDASASEEAAEMNAGRPSENDGVSISLDPGSDELPSDEGNLAYRGAVLMAESYGAGLNGMVRISVRKNIPLAAGLAGGSGNGAAVVLALAYLWDVDAEFDELAKIAAKLGSDVPFSLMGIAAMNPVAGFSDDKMAATCARATGTGTDLEPLPSVEAFVVLSKPPEGVSTASAYRAIDNIEITEHPDVKQQAEAIGRHDMAGVTENMINVLENYTLAEYESVVRTKEMMLREAEGKASVLMSGSGPTVFALADDEKTCRRIYEALQTLNSETFLTETI